MRRNIVTFVAEQYLVTALLVRNRIQLQKCPRCGAVTAVAARPLHFLERLNDVCNGRCIPAGRRRDCLGSHWQCVWCRLEGREAKEGRLASLGGNVDVLCLLSGHDGGFGVGGRNQVNCKADKACFALCRPLWKLGPRLDQGLLRLLRRNGRWSSRGCGRCRCWLRFWLSQLEEQLERLIAHCSGRMGAGELFLTNKSWQQTEELPTYPRYLLYKSPA